MSFTYFNFKISVEHSTGQTYRISISSQEGGETHELSEFPFDDGTLNKKLKGLSKVLRTTGTRAMGRRTDDPADKPMTAEDIQEFGHQLFDFLFPRESLTQLRKVTNVAAGTKNTGVRLQLRFAENAAKLAAIPWEFLRDKTNRDFVSLNNQTPLVRYIDIAKSIGSLLSPPPLKILGMISNPLNDLNVEKERKWVEDALKNLIDNGRVTLSWIEGDTARDLQSAIRTGDYHVFHYIGHGGFDDVNQEGFLLLGNGQGGTVNLMARSLARLLSVERFKLALLNACEGATADSENLFSSTATTLVNEGILAVMAMQYPISDTVAIELARTFYGAVADGASVDYALADARNMISINFQDSAEWANPVLFMRSSDAQLIESPNTPDPEPEPTPAPLPVKPVDDDPDDWDENNIKKVKARDVRKFIENMFTLEEIRNLCADMGKSHEDLAGTTRGALARELIDYCRRYRKSDELLELINDDHKTKLKAYFEHSGPISE